MMEIVFECNEDGSVEPYYSSGASWEKWTPEELMEMNPDLDYHFFVARVELHPVEV